MSAVNTLKRPAEVSHAEGNPAKKQKLSQNPDADKKMENEEAAKDVPADPTTPPSKPNPVAVYDDEPLPSSVVDSPGSIFRQMGLRTPRTIGELRQVLVDHPEILRMIPRRKPTQRRHTRVGDRYQAEIPPCVKKPSFADEAVIGFSVNINSEEDAAKRIEERRELVKQLEAEEKKGGVEEEEEEDPASLLSVLAGGDLEDDEDADEDYDFEDRSTKATGIVARRLHLLPGEKREEGKIQFLVRWDGGTSSWEFAETLKGGFDDMIERYEYDHDLAEEPVYEPEDMADWANAKGSADIATAKDVATPPEQKPENPAQADTKDAPQT